MRDYVTFKARQITGKGAYKKGDVILSSMPFAYVVDSRKRGKYCDNCLQLDGNRTLLPCKGCNFNFYCSRACEQEGWDFVHKFECPCLKKITSKPGESLPNFVRLLARVIFRLKDGGDKYEEKFCNNRGRKFKDLMNHYKDIKNDPSRMKDVHNMMEILKRYIGEGNVPNESDFIGIYGRALVNRFCLSDQHNSPLGSGIYLAGSVFDHSCMPNAHPSFIGKKLFVRTLVDIRELNLDKVRICYADCINSREVRRLELYKHWYFWCECELCNDSSRQHKENFILCENPNCGSEISVPPRYSKFEDYEEELQLPEQDKKSQLNNALKASRLQFNFANITVNPFASTDACLSYIYYDKDRYKPASDSELETDDDDDDDEPPSPKLESLAESTITVVDDNTNDPSSNNSNRDSMRDGALINGNFSSLHQSRKKSLVPLTNTITPEEITAKKLPQDKQLSKDRNDANGSQNNFNLIEDLNKIKQTGTKPKATWMNGEKQNVNAKMRTSEKHVSGDYQGEAITVNGSQDNYHEPQTNGEAKATCADKVEVNDYTSSTLTVAATMTKMAEEHADKMKKMRRKPKVFEQSSVLCPECRCFVDRNTLREYRSAVGFTILRLKDMKEDSPDFQVVLDVIERQGTIIQKLNVWRVRVLDFAFNAAYFGGAWMLALKYGQENLEGMRYYYSNKHPSLGFFYMKMGKALLSMKMYREGLQFLNLSKELLNVALGANHPFITVVIRDLELLANEDRDIYMERRLAQKKEQITEIICPCCGRKKVIRHEDTSEINSKPWEKDMLFRQKMKEDSEFFSTSYEKY